MVAAAGSTRSVDKAVDAVSDGATGDPQTPQKRSPGVIALRQFGHGVVVSRHRVKRCMEHSWIVSPSRGAFDP
jgi:hypothetical protein